VDREEAPLTQLAIRIDSADERSALEAALLRARATELGEIRRRNTRLVTGYGDATTRDVMTDEADRARLRWTMLDRLLDALERTGPGDEGG
jgi:hypothetical protein